MLFVSDKIYANLAFNRVYTGSMVLAYGQFLTYAIIQLTLLQKCSGNDFFYYRKNKHGII